MKLGLSRVVVVSCPALMLLITTSVVASQAPEMDPAKLAPHIYAIELENEQVRVLRVTVRPNETPPMHSHPNRVVVYVNQCSGLIPADDGGMRRVTFNAGDFLWLAGETHGNQPNTVESECEVLEIELKD